MALTDSSPGLTDTLNALLTAEKEKATMLDRLKNESERSFWQRMHLYYTMKAEEEVSHFPSGAQVYATLAAAAATRALSERVVNS